MDNICYCPACGTKKDLNKGFACPNPNCNDASPYDPVQPFFDPFRPRCPGCGKKVWKTTYCQICGHYLGHPFHSLFLKR